MKKFILRTAVVGSLAVGCLATTAQANIDEGADAAWGAVKAVTRVSQSLIKESEGEDFARRRVTRCVLFNGRRICY